MTPPAPDAIALFYNGFERKADPGLKGGVYSNARGGLRDAYRRLRDAMSSGVPVLAWDDGVLVDPVPAVSSAPYFDDRCGLRFRLETFETALPDFVASMGRFGPRDYGVDELSLARSGARSGARYIELYHQARARG